MHITINQSFGKDVQSNQNLSYYATSIKCHEPEIFHVSLTNIMHYFNKPFDLRIFFQKKWNCIFTWDWIKGTWIAW
jgi:hypothetical protein